MNLKLNFRYDFSIRKSRVENESLAFLAGFLTKMIMIDNVNLGIGARLYNFITGDPENANPYLGIQFKNVAQDTLQAAKEGIVRLQEYICADYNFSRKAEKIVEILEIICKDNDANIIELAHLIKENFNSFLTEETNLGWVSAMKIIIDLNTYNGKYNIINYSTIERMLSNSYSPFVIIEHNEASKTKEVILLLNIPNDLTIYNSLMKARIENLVPKVVFNKYTEDEKISNNRLNEYYDKINKLLEKITTICLVECSGYDTIKAAQKIFEAKGNIQKLLCYINANTFSKQITAGNKYANNDFKELREKLNYFENSLIELQVDFSKESKYKKFANEIKELYDFECWFCNHKNHQNDIATINIALNKSPLQFTVREVQMCNEIKDGKSCFAKRNFITLDKILGRGIRRYFANLKIVFY